MVQELCVRGVAERERESSRQEAWVDGFNQGGERQGEDVGWGAAGLLLGYGGQGVGRARRMGNRDGSVVLRPGCSELERKGKAMGVAAVLAVGFVKEED